MLPLLSNEQVDTETQHLRALDPSTIPRLRITTTEGKRDLLHKNITKTLCREIDSIVKNYDSLIQSISCTIGGAQKHLEDEEVRYTTSVSTQPEEESLSGSADCGNTSSLKKRV